MASKKQFLDKNGTAVKVGDRCTYNHPAFWNMPGGEVEGVLGWDNRMKRHVLLVDGVSHSVNFTYAGLDKGQCAYLAKVVPDELDEPLTKEEIKEMEMSWPEFEYIEEPELLAEELEDDAL